MTDKKPSRHVDAWRQIWISKVDQYIQLEELVSHLAEIDLADFVDEINKVGSRDLGNGCELVSCHGCDHDAVCFLFPWEETESQTSYTKLCSGPFYEINDGGFLTRLAKQSVTPIGEQSTKRKMKIGGGRHKLAYELPKKDCPYSFFYQDIDMDSFAENR
jgi:hypothetical protein